MPIGHKKSMHRSVGSCLCTMVVTCRIFVGFGSQPHFGDESGGLERGATCPAGPLMIVSTSLLFGTKHCGRRGAPRSSNGRMPIGQKKSVHRSVGSRNLRAGGSLGEVEVIEVEEEEDVGEETSESDGEEERGPEVEEVEDAYSSSSSSSSSKTIEERSIGGRAAFFEAKKKISVSQKHMGCS